MTVSLTEFYVVLTDINFELKNITDFYVRKRAIVTPPNLYIQKYRNVHILLEIRELLDVHFTCVNWNYNNSCTIDIFALKYPVWQFRMYVIFVMLQKFTNMSIILVCCLNRSGYQNINICSLMQYSVRNMYCA